MIGTHSQESYPNEIKIENNQYKQTSKLSSIKVYELVNKIYPIEWN